MNFSHFILSILKLVITAKVYFIIFSVVLFVRHLLMVTGLKDSAGFFRLKLSDLNLSPPVLHAFLKFHNFVLLHDELDGVSGLLVHLDLSQVAFSVEDNFVQIFLRGRDLSLFLLKLLGLVGEGSFGGIALDHLFLEFVAARLQLSSGLGGAGLLSEELFVLLVDVLDILFVLDLK